MKKIVNIWEKFSVVQKIVGPMKICWPATTPPFLQNLPIT